ARLHAGPAADAAVLVEDHRAERGLAERRGRPRRGAGRVVAVHAELTAEHPVGPGAGDDLVERDERVVVGVEVARVLIPGAGEEIGVVGRPVVPRLARHHAGAAADAARVVLDHRLRLRRGRRHAEAFFLMLQRNTLVSGIPELASPTLAVRSLAMSPGTMPA